jgi:hypothetical protein
MSTPPETLDALRARHTRLAVYLSRDGCGPCAAVWPTVQAAFASDPAWTLERIDADEHPEVAGQLLVFSVPALVLFWGGREAWRAARVLRQTEVARAKAQIDAAATTPDAG